VFLKEVIGRFGFWKKTERTQLGEQADLLLESELGLKTTWPQSRLWKGLWSRSQLEPRGGSNVDGTDMVELLDFRI
jgi:hypothetical protein